MNYNNNCTNVVFLWINQKNGKIMVNARANPNITLSSNKIGTTGKIQNKSKTSSTYKENWIYEVKKSYEQDMNIKRKSRSMSDEFYLDFVTDTFSTIVIYFTNEQEGFDFRNQLVDALLLLDLTYNKKKDITSQINPTNNVPRTFNQLTTIINSISYNLNDLSNFFEKVFNTYSEYGVYSEPCENTSITNNEITREMLEKAKIKTTTKRFCKYCGVEVSTTGICSGFNCDYSGEKVEVIIMELAK